MTWKTFRLDDVCQIQSGNSIAAKKKTELFTNVFGTPYVATKDVGFDGSIDYENGIYIPKEHVSSFKISPSGSTLVCAEGGSAGRKIAFSTNDCCYVNKLFSITPSESLEAKYIYYYTLSCEFQSQFKAALHGLIGGVSLKKIKEFTISIPSLAEQERIVAKLDAAFAEIDRAINVALVKEKKVKKLDRFLLENLFQENFDKKRIGDLGDVKSGGTPKSTEQSYWGGEIDWYSSGELNNIYSSQTVKHITNKGLSNSNAKIFPKGSLLVGMYDTAAMKMTILQKEATFNQAIAGIPPNQFALPEYLYYALNFLKPKILLERRGTRQQNLTLAKIKNIEIPIPSMKHQQHIISQANIAAQEIKSILKALSDKKAQLSILKSVILFHELQSSEAA